LTFGCGLVILIANFRTLAVGSVFNGVFVIW
jgi:hypothetical protein